MMQNAGVFDILTCKCACRHSGVPFFHHFSTSERPKVVRTPQFFDILTLKCASRHSGVQFFDIATSKNGPPLRCFAHFHLKMYFSLQRRATFSTFQLQKVVRTCSVLYILTSKCASRYSGVQFLHIATSKSGPSPSVFLHFDFEMCFSPQRRAIFPQRNFKKWSEHVARGTF